MDFFKYEFFFGKLFPPNKYIGKNNSQDDTWDIDQIRKTTIIFKWQNSWIVELFYNEANKKQLS